MLAVNKDVTGRIRGRHGAGEAPLVGCRAAKPISPCFLEFRPDAKSAAQRETNNLGEQVGIPTRHRS